MNLKTLKCRNCGERGVPKNNSTIGFYCDKEDCQNVRIAKAVKKVRENQSKDWRKEKKVLKEKLKTLEAWKADLQVVINSIVRLIDYGQPCIATGATTGKRNAGHRISVGANRTTRFNLHNIHIQSEHSNKWKGGDNIRYDEGLERVYGKGYLEYVRSLNQIKPIHLTIDEVKEAIKKARAIEKHLKLEGEQIYTPQQRLELRSIYNNVIGIYK